MTTPKKPKPKQYDREKYRKKTIPFTLRFKDEETKEKVFQKLDELYGPKRTRQALIELLIEEKTNIKLD